MKFRGYDLNVEKVSVDLGGGFVTFAPALKGCIADGATRDQALQDLEMRSIVGLRRLERRDIAFRWPINHQNPNRAVQRIGPG